VAKKTRVELALADDLDAGRTLVRLKYRQMARHELNEVEDKIRKGHSSRVLRGLLPKPIDTTKILGAYETTNGK